MPSDRAGSVADRRRGRGPTSWCSRDHLGRPASSAFNSLRLQRSLALIAIRRDLQHRSRLAFELWPDSNERQARTNLRKLLHDFRHSLPDIGEFVEIDNEMSVDSDWPERGRRAEVPRCYGGR